MSDLVERPDNATREAEMEAAIRRYGHVSFTEKTPHRELVGEANKLHGYRSALLRIIDAERAKSEGLRAVLAGREQEISSLVSAFRHHHKPATVNRDKCETCGFDLRDDVHIRARSMDQVMGRAALSASPSPTLQTPSDAADAARYRYLRDHCSSHYPMTHEQPAEWSISWDFQQRTPAERFGSFAALIDKDIERLEAGTMNAPDACTAEARAEGCTCRMESVNSASIDPPEPITDPWCPLHGCRDAGREYQEIKDGGPPQNLDRGTDDGF